MRTIETTARVSEDGTLTVRVPPDVAPGEHRIVVVIDEELANDASDKETAKGTLSLAGSLPAARKLDGWRVHDVGPWPEGLSLRREDMYDDWGR